MIIISFAFYLLVIFLVQVFPLIGLLVTPKAYAYLTIARVATRWLGKRK